jgi:hypothetical protein
MTSMDRNVGASCPCPHPSSILFPLLSPSFKMVLFRLSSTYSIISTKFLCLCNPFLNLRTYHPILPGLSKVRSRKQFLKTPHNPQKTANSFYMAESYRVTKHSTYIIPQNSHIHTNPGKLNSSQTGLTKSSRIAQPALIKPLS